MITNHRTNLDKARQDLFYIQHRIYQASIECDMLLVHSLQKLLMSNILIRQLATFQAGHCIELIDQSDTCFRNNYINSQVIVWCLEAEWQSKMSNQYVNFRKTQLYTRFWSYRNAQVRQTLLNVDMNYLILKLQSPDRITQGLKKIIDNESWAQASQAKCRTFLVTQAASNYLKEMLYTILCDGVQWNHYRQSLQNTSVVQSKYRGLWSEKYFTKPCKILCWFLHNCGITLRQSVLSRNNELFLNNQIEKSLVNKIREYVKDQAFYKNDLGKRKVRHFCSESKHIHQIERGLGQWSQYYMTVIKEIKVHTYLDKCHYSLP
uniref:Reverse transcriptase N-terminal domain-containing protein n=1 Tax=Yamadaella caenomyce TaxID=259029 RepID=A0A1G4NYM1_9FLOR|nr:Hypothetical protein ORF_3 [Yamadaella caenomyce]SCW23780.1 Hypothetical protein ORF_3 [Yamadaella caenomyce]